MCYVDPFDPANQVRFYRQDPTGRTVPLSVEDGTTGTPWFDRIVIGICLVVLAVWVMAHDLVGVFK